jgi:hypothetical protein
VIADRLHGETANPPERKGDQRDDPERAPPARIEGLLGKARRHKAGDVDLLPVGVGARLVEPMQRVLIGGLGKAALALQLLV